MSWRDIRPVAVGVPRRDDEVLLCRLRDETADETFYRPIGGGIEFGEMSEEALGREFREELDVELSSYDLLETLERTFTFHGDRGHEIWFLYDVAFEEDWPYERDEFEGVEDDGEPFPSVWVPLERLSDVTVYPSDLRSLL